MERWNDRTIDRSIERANERASERASERVDAPDCGGYHRDAASRSGLTSAAGGGAGRGRARPRVTRITRLFATYQPFITTCHSFIRSTSEAPHI